MSAIKLEVVTPEKAVLSEFADDVVLPGVLGQMDILPGHLPLLSLLDVGQMEVRKGGQVRYFLISQGYVEVSDDKVTVLTELCEGVNDIDIEQARGALKDLEKELLDLEEVSKSETVEEEVFRKHRLALKKQRERVAFAEERGGKTSGGGQEARYDR